jgi:hypothetical protein
LWSDTYSSQLRNPAEPLIGRTPPSEVEPGKKIAMVYRHSDLLNPITTDSHSNAKHGGSIFVTKSKRYVPNLNRPVFPIFTLRDDFFLHSQTGTTGLSRPAGISSDSDSWYARFAPKSARGACVDMQSHFSRMSARIQFQKIHCKSGWG